MDSKNQNSLGGETFYLLSTDDAERINEMFEMVEIIRKTYWELMAGRQVNFPNSIYTQAYKNVRRECLDLEF